MKTLSHTKQKDQEKFKITDDKVNSHNISRLKRMFATGYITKGMRRILGVLFHEDIKNKRSLLFQAKIAYEADLTRTYTNECLSDLVALGLMHSHNRGYNSCLYFLHPAFYHPEVRRFLKAFEGFSFLKVLTLLMLLSFSNSSSQSSNPTSCYYLRSRSYLESLYIRERVLLGQTAARLFKIKNKREMIMTMVTPLNREISANLGLTAYCSLQLSAFDDSVLKSASHYLSLKRETVTNKALFMLKLCRKICKAKNLKPNYGEMLMAVHVAGFKPGDRLLLVDVEAQPRFDEQPYIAPKEVEVKPTKPQSFNKKLTVSKFGPKSNYSPGYSRPGSVPFKRTVVEERAMARFAERRKLLYSEPDTHHKDIDFTI